ncbi:uncharacterized protein METZ01_LOCUS391407, partial [marine metagenome]
MRFGLSDTDGPNDSRFYAQLKIPWLEIVQGFGTYMNLDEVLHASSSTKCPRITSKPSLAGNLRRAMTPKTIRNHTLLAIIITALLVPHTAWASDWVEAIGQAVIEEDEAKARNQAIANALRFCVEQVTGVVIKSAFSHTQRE